jgi:hypothetical protein
MIEAKAPLVSKETPPSPASIEIPKNPQQKSWDPRGYKMSVDFSAQDGKSVHAVLDHWGKVISVFPSDHDVKRMSRGGWGGCLRRAAEELWPTYGMVLKWLNDNAVKFPRYGKRLVDQPKRKGRNRHQTFRPRLDRIEGRVTCRTNTGFISIPYDEVIRVATSGAASILWIDEFNSLYAVDPNKAVEVFDVKYDYERYKEKHEEHMRTGMCMKCLKPVDLPKDSNAAFCFNCKRYDVAQPIEGV